MTGSPEDIYTPAFFSTVAEGSQVSARAVVPVVARWLSPCRVVDVGCGEGAWAREFAGTGCDVLGVDGAFVDPSRLRIALQDFVMHDLREPLPSAVLDWGADLVVCLEVAEHLPPARGPGLVRDLCRTAETVLFSAAVPGQGGHGHVNERPQEYWVELFEDTGFGVSRVLQRRLRDLDAVEWWYRQNLLVARRIAPSPSRGRTATRQD